MPSIRWLLDTFGQPPSQIALDWACQIAAAVPPAGDAERDHSDDLLSEQEDWTKFEVAEDGMLQLAGISRVMVDRALEDLRGWIPAARAVTRGAGSDRARIECALATLTQSTSDVTNKVPIDDAFASIDRLAQSPVTVTLRSQRRTHSGSQTLATTSLAWFAKHKRRASAGLATICVAGLLPLVWPRSDKSQPRVSASSPLAHAATSEWGRSRTADGPQPVVRASDPPTVEAADLGAFTSTAELVGLEPKHVQTPLAAPSPTLLSAALDLSSPLIAPPAPKSTTSGTVDVIGLDSRSITNSEQAPINNEQGSKVSDDARSSQPSAAINETLGAPSAIDDVMQHVAGLVAAAELNATETNDRAIQEQLTPGAEPTAAEDWIDQPALTLSRDRMRLHVELPRAMRERVHDPNWLVRIELGEGFVCEPVDEQSLAPRSAAVFRIYDELAGTPRACVNVQLFNRAGRDCVLDWNISGGSEDMPGLRLPLARRWLDALRAQLNVSVNSLRALTEASLPSASGPLRTLFQNQRRLAAEQLKIAKRLLAVTAELDRLAALVDEEIKCQAQLREGPSGRVVLNFGNVVRASPEAVDPTHN